MADQPLDQTENVSGKGPDAQANGVPASGGAQPQQDAGQPAQVPNAAQEQGMTVDVTPQRPAQPRQMYVKREVPKKSPLAKIAVIVIVIAAAAGVLLFAGSLHHATTSTSTTTIATAVGAVSSCQVIDKPGLYYVANNIEAQGTGACITMRASNVSLICNQHSIMGKGPYSNATPYTYGILINGSSHDSVSGCAVGSFSYGIYTANASSLTLANNNVSLNAMADVYMYNAPGSTVSRNYLSKASSYQGALFMSGNTTGSDVYNNTIEDNAQVGVYVNSTGNIFTNNYVNASLSSFACAAPDGFSGSSRAQSNVCDINNGCNFLRCSIENIPLNFSRIRLSSYIRSCGSIDSPGIYAIESPLSPDVYIPGIKQNYTTSCITVNADNVSLDCNRYPINGASIGISASSVANLAISNCNIANSAFGLVFNGVNSSNVTDSTFTNGVTGVVLQHSSGNQLRNISVTGQNDGVYLQNSTLNEFDSFNASDNVYGLYINGSTGNVFNKGVVENNSRIDVYATNNSVNASYNVMQDTACGVTDAVWAPCQQHITKSLKFYPVNSCLTIRRSGNYTMTQNIVTSAAQCFNVRVSNVRLSCAGFSITEDNSGLNSTAVLAQNVTNVSVENCAIASFTRGVTLKNASDVQVNSSTISASPTGIALSSVRNATVSNNNVYGSTVAGIRMFNASYTSVYSNNVSQGKPSGIGILMNDSPNNRVYNNFASGDMVGLYVSAGALNNTIFNNTAQLSGTYAYYCTPAASAIGAERGGANYGVDKYGCTWLAGIEAPQTNTCTAFFTPTTYQLAGDMVYPTGTTCYGVYANSTTINCMGHTVLAQNGGTFASFKNVKDGLIENCNLKGFTTPIVAVNSSIRVVNNTIFGNLTGTAAQASISVARSPSAEILQNNISSTAVGMSLRNVSGGYVRDNYVSAVYDALDLYNTSGTAVYGNTAHSLKGAGIAFLGSVADTFANNLLYGFTYGLACIGSSTGQTAVSDGGQNFCSSQVGCAWLQSSASTC